LASAALGFFGLTSTAIAAVYTTALDALHDMAAARWRRDRQSLSWLVQPWPVCGERHAA
jgi:hypothetical protein